MAAAGPGRPPGRQAGADQRLRRAHAAGGRGGAARVAERVRPGRATACPTGPGRRRRGRVVRRRHGRQRARRRAAVTGEGLPHRLLPAPPVQVGGDGGEGESDRGRLRVASPASNAQAVRPAVCRSSPPRSPAHTDRVRTLLVAALVLAVLTAVPRARCTVIAHLLVALVAGGVLAVSPDEWGSRRTPPSGWVQYDANW
ncbi:DUF6234 family protein [Streptomyces sp. NPDC093260]|uniref:DUF6234 family protein n=1 Tax=Streptomyces sp. NPDC093260 TaxID=3155073 RepID=UPI00342D3501